MDMDNLASRLAALEAEVALHRDQLAVQRLILSYSPLVDTADGPERADRVAELWTDDGVYDIGGMGPKRGRAEIAAGYATRHFGNVQLGVAHVMGPPYISVDGNRAAAINYTCVFRPDGEDRFYPWRISANFWDLVRVDGRWRVESRDNRMMTGDSEALAILRRIEDLLPGTA